MEDGGKEKVDERKESVLVLACINPEIKSEVMDVAMKHGMEVVTLDDNVVTDYLRMKDNDKAKTVAELTANPENRRKAEDFLRKLWVILTKDKDIKVEDANTVTFRKADVVKETTLTNKGAEELLTLLNAFGMLRFTRGRHEFQLNFTAEDIHRTIRLEATALAVALRSDLERLENSYLADAGIKEEEREERLREFREFLSREASIVK